MSDEPEGVIALVANLGDPILRLLEVPQNAIGEATGRFQLVLQAFDHGHGRFSGSGLAGTITRDAGVTKDTYEVSDLLIGATSEEHFVDLLLKLLDHGT